LNGCVSQANARHLAQKETMMRKIIAGMFITLDGVIEAPEKWNPPFYNQEMTDAVQGQLASCDTHLYGRRSYELFRSVFTGPAAKQIPHAPLMNETPKIVVSTTLTDADWGPATVISSDVVARLADLKHQTGQGHHCRGQRHTRPLAAQRGAPR
jgi:hypothetical protein